MFKVGDKIRQLTSCSGTIAGKEYTLHFGYTNGYDKQTLVAWDKDTKQREPGCSGCSCQQYWELLTRSVPTGSIKVKSGTTEMNNIGMPHDSGTTEMNNIGMPHDSGTTELNNIGFVTGAFGDMEGCEGLLENVIKPPEGGTFMKFVGCSYLFKGFPMNQFVENLGLAKALISFLPRMIILRSFLFTSSFVLLFIFARKRLIHYLNLYFGMIFDRTVVRANMNEKRYNMFVKELRRATGVALSKEYLIKKSFIDYSAVELKDNEANFNLRKLELSVLLAKITHLIYFFLEHDNAYRFRAQDVLENINKENAKKNVVAEVDKLFQLLFERENPLYGERVKWVAIRKMVVFFLRFSPMARRVTRNILLEIEIDKVKLDEADWYFCLRRKTYNFRGVSLELRLREKELIDKEKVHNIPKFVYGKPPQNG